jgi:hypothetical protein
MQRSTSTGSREPPSLDDLADMGDTDRVLERGRLLGDGDLFLLRPFSSSSSVMACIVLPLAPGAALLEADACPPRS